MFATLTRRLASRLRRGVDVSLEFATLGEYRLETSRDRGLECELRHARPLGHELQRRPASVGAAPATPAAARSRRRGGMDAGTPRTPCAVGE